MSSTVGKITGQMLENNLLRDGVDLAFDTDLIYLDVDNNRVGIKNTTPIRPLHISGTLSTDNLIVDVSASISNFVFSGNTVANINNNILLSSLQPGGKITAGEILVDGLRINNNTLDSIRSNENIDFTASGFGDIEFYSNVEVLANIHVTGDVTFDGTLTLGNSQDDSIVFDTEVASNIVPDLNNTYSLGVPSRKWNSLSTNLINGGIITGIDGAVVNGIDLNLRPGNTWFVAVNGGSSNYGDHVHDPFDKIEDALAVATAGDTVYIFPGTYYELLPLTIPVGVTVKGFGVRSVTIKPDTASAGENVFLLNGESTVEDLTIADFYYDNLNDKGYAFSFAPGFAVTSRSPYIRNVTVITKGSVTSVSDPRGYDAGDAGRGAKIDGSLANVASKEASMLFHSVTFITPGQRCLWMTNGVRVEWLNCFIYFASEGLYANAGATGFASDGKTRLKIYGISAQTVNAGDTVSIENVSAGGSFTTATIESVSYNGVYTNVVIDGYVTGWETSATPPDTSNQQQINFSGGQTASHLEWVDYSDFGAEVRAIGSANVYGLVGAKADGDGTIMYLISHNFGYIGSGKLATNDVSDVIDTNETVELNNGKIYYQSMDQEGNFRVGDVFKVESATGRVVFQSNLFNGTNLLLTNGSDQTYVDAVEISTGNITITGNTIQSNTGGITFNAANTDLDITSNFTTNNNLTVNNNVSFNKNVTVGNTASDSIEFRSRINSNFIPDSSYLLLGTNFKRWHTLYSANLTFDDIVIDTNVITTTQSNSNLQLDANGVVYFENLILTNNTISSLSSANININPDGLGTIQLQKDTDITGNLDITGNATVGGNVQIGDIYLDTINPVGKIGSNIMPYTTGTHDIGSYTNRWNNIFLDELVVDDIKIDTNVIESTVSNQNLELRANGTGSIRIDQLDFNDNNIVSNQSNTNININPDGVGTIQLQKDTDITGNLDITGSATVGGNVQIGDVALDTINPVGRIGSDIMPAYTGTYDIGTDLLRWNTVYVSKYVNDDITIDTNLITTTSSNQNLELNANGTGRVVFESLTISDNVISSFNINQNININPNGQGSIELQADTFISQQLTMTGPVFFTSNIDLGSSATNTIKFIGSIDSNLLPNQTAQYNLGSNLKRWNNLYSSQLLIDDIKIDTNVIESTLSNQNLEFRANGTGSIRIDQLDFKNNTILSNLTNTNINLNPNGIGTIQLQKNTSITGNLDVSNNVTVGGNVILGDVVLDTIDPIGRIDSNLIPDITGTYDIGSTVRTWRNLYFSNSLINDILINDNSISTVNSNSDLELLANGTGQVRITDNMIANQNITVSGTSTFSAVNLIGTLNINGFPTVTNTLTAPEFKVDDILINDNYITTTLSNSNLELRANNAGGVILDGSLRITNSTIENILTTGTESQRSITFTPDTTNIVKINSTAAIKLPAGSTVDRTPSQLGEIRFNSTTLMPEGYVTGGTRSLYALFDVDRNTGITAELVPGTNDNTIRLYSNSLIIGSITASTSTFTRVTVDEIRLDANQISTNNTNSDLELDPSGTGLIKFKDNFTFTNNVITNIVNDAVTELQTTGSGVYKFEGTGAVVIPVGVDAERLVSPPVGATRYSTEQQYAEVWDGSLWIPVRGDTSSLISQQEMEDLTYYYTLMLG